MTIGVLFSILLTGIQTSVQERRSANLQLVQAIQRNDLIAFHRALAAGADPWDLDAMPSHPIGEAIIRNEVEIMDALIAEYRRLGFRVEQKLADLGYTACVVGRPMILEHLLARGLIATANDDRSPLLMVSLDRRDIRSFGLLLSKGASPYSTSFLGLDVLDYAIIRPEGAFLDLMLSKRFDMAVKDADGTPPIVVAAKIDDPKLRYNRCSKLLAYKVDPNIADKHGESAAFYSVHDRHLLSLLRRFGANLNKLNKDGLGATHLAAIADDAAAWKNLVQQGADPWATSAEGLPPLFYAINCGSGHIVDLISHTKRVAARSR